VGEDLGFDRRVGERCKADVGERDSLSLGQGKVFPVGRTVLVRDRVRVRVCLCV
jgi:hypothetical protein